MLDSRNTDFRNFGKPFSVIGHLKMLRSSKSLQIKKNSDIMIEIEFENPIIEKCDCCGDEMVRLTRFVYQDGGAFAVYYAKFTKSHDDKVVYGLISLGGWGEGTGPDDRLAFPFRIWANEENYQVGLTDKEQSPWKDVEFLGQILDRQEALVHPWLKDVFHITDHIVVDDKLIVDYFNQSPNSGL